MLYSPGINGSTIRIVPYEQLGYIIFILNHIASLLISNKRALVTNQILLLTIIMMYVVLMFKSNFSLGYIASFSSIVFLFQNERTLNHFNASLSIVVFFLLLGFFAPFLIDTLPFHYGDFDRRYSGMVQTSTLYGVTVSILSYHLTNGRKILNWIFFFLVLVSVILSGSRTALVAFALFNGRKVLILLPFVLFALIYLIEDVGEKIYFARRLVRADDYSTLGGRTDKFDSVWEIFSSQSLSDQIFGLGYGNFAYLGLEVSAHSNWLRILVEGGLVGLLILVCWYFVASIIIVNKRSISILVLLLIDSSLAIHFSLSYLWIFTLVQLVVLSNKNDVKSFLVHSSY